MTLMRWTPAMSVGLKELDDDHKMLFRVINQLAENSGQEGREGALRRCIFALMRYAEFHFAREEKVMAACGVAEIEAHKAEHHLFIERISAVSKALDQPGTAGSPIDTELLEYLKDWLNHHILIVDMSYRPLVEGNAEATAAAQSFKAAEVWWSQ